VVVDTGSDFIVKDSDILVVMGQEEALKRLQV